MDAYPLVSVLMTAYNREKYISEAIESVIESTYSNWELIITDDCSTDATLKIARKYALLDSRIRVYQNETNLGDYPNRNKAASYAKGIYLKYLDADDLIYPYGLAAMVDAMQKFPDAGFALSFSVIDDLLPYPHFVNQVDIIRNEYLNKSFLNVGPSASIIRKDLFRAMGEFSGQQFIGDTELWLKMASAYSMAKMAPALVWYRRHTGQQFAIERQNYEIKVKRYMLSINFLYKHKDIFNAAEYKFAQSKLKRNFSRVILRELLHSYNLKRYLYINRKAGLGFLDMLRGIMPYLENSKPS